MHSKLKLNIFGFDFFFRFVFNSIFNRWIRIGIISYDSIVQFLNLPNTKRRPKVQVSEFLRDRVQIQIKYIGRNISLIIV